MKLRLALLAPLLAIGALHPASAAGQAPSCPSPDTAGNVDLTLVAIMENRPGAQRKTVETVFRVRGTEVQFEAPDYSGYTIVGYEWYRRGNLVKSCGDTFKEQPLLADGFESGDLSKWTTPPIVSPTPTRTPTPAFQGTPVPNRRIP